MNRKLTSVIFIISIVVLISIATIINVNLVNNNEKIKTKSKAKIEYHKPDEKYLLENNLGKFNTSLPVMFLDTHNQRLSKENIIWGDIALLEKDKAIKSHNIYDEPHWASSATINLRGASSYTFFDKKQYKIKFYKEKETNLENEIKLLGMNKHSEWVLNGPFLDKTLIRNKLVYDISEQIFDWSPRAEFLELFVDGRYQGVYLAIEAIDRSESRLDLNKFGLLSGQTAYILKRDRLDSDINPIMSYGQVSSYTSNQLYIEYPTKNRLTRIQKDWIEKDISEFEKALYSKDFLDKKKGYYKYIDIDEFVDYFILNEVVMNYDASYLSTYIYKDISSLLKLTVWDYNNSYDNFIEKKINYDEFILDEGIYFGRLLKDREFVDKVVKRYLELRMSVLKTENFRLLINSYNKELNDAIRRNFVIWGYSFDLNMLVGEGRDLNSYNGAMEQLDNAINRRFSFLDEHIVDLYDLCIN